MSILNNTKSVSCELIKKYSNFVNWSHVSRTAGGTRHTINPKQNKLPKEHRELVTRILKAIEQAIDGKTEKAPRQKRNPNADKRGVEPKRKPGQTADLAV